MVERMIPSGRPRPHKRCSGVLWHEEGRPRCRATTEDGVYVHGFHAWFCVDCEERIAGYVRMLDNAGG